MRDWSFYRGRKILVTGHTGFKGSWIVQLLLELGAEVTGYALEPPTEPSAFRICGLGGEIDSEIGDIRDLERLRSVVKRVQPELILHMAAQPIVRESYRIPVYTYDVNVMGTVNILECTRTNDCVKSFVNVTTDKVYRNREWQWGYRENEELNGFDPYSNSKSCSELVTDGYRNSFFGPETGRVLPVSTMRAGNVIGGGDFAADRISPDCFRAIQRGEPVGVRNPYSIRPYQHVLEAVAAYLLLLERQYGDPTLAGSYNVGPDEADCRNTESIVRIFCGAWRKYTGQAVNWTVQSDGGPHEASFLKLDCTKLKCTLDWKPIWNVEQAIQKTAEWYADYLNGHNMREVTSRQIREFLEAYA